MVVDEAIVLTECDVDDELLGQSKPPKTKFGKRARVWMIGFGLIAILVVIAGANKLMSHPLSNLQADDFVSLAAGDNFIVLPICPEACSNEESDEEGLKCCKEKVGFVDGMCRMNGPGNACKCSNAGGEGSAEKCMYLATGDDRLLRMTPMLRSHDAATFFAGSDAIKAQNANFRQQLECGARAFDIRLVVEDGVSKFQHCPGPGNELLSSICVMSDQDVEQEMAAFEEFIKENPDELIIIHFSHCLIAQAVEFEGLTCLDGRLMDQFRNRNWAILNEAGHDAQWKECDQGKCLDTFTVGQAKAFAKEGKFGDTIVPKWNENKDRQAGILVISDDDTQGMINDHYVEDVHNDWGAMITYTKGYLGLADATQWVFNWANAEDKFSYTRMQTYQGHWQSSGAFGANAVPADVQDGKSLNMWVADANEPIMQNKASGKVNMVDMNWVCDEGTKKVGADFLNFAKNGR